MSEHIIRILKAPEGAPPRAWEVELQVDQLAAALTAMGYQVEVVHDIDHFAEMRGVYPEPEHDGQRDADERGWLVDEAYDAFMDQRAIAARFNAEAS